ALRTRLTRASARGADRTGCTGDRAAASTPGGMRKRMCAMMDHMMGGGGMMWAMGLVWLLLIVVLLRAAAGLVKYLFFSNRCVLAQSELWLSTLHGRLLSARFRTR